jgi:hypothetical protein
VEFAWSGTTGPIPYRWLRCFQSAIIFKSKHSSESTAGLRLEQAHTPSVTYCETHRIALVLLVIGVICKTRFARSRWWTSPVLGYNISLANQTGYNPKKPFSTGRKVKHISCIPM